MRSSIRLVTLFCKTAKVRASNKVQVQRKTNGQCFLSTQPSYVRICRPKKKAILNHFLPMPIGVKTRRTTTAHQHQQYPRRCCSSCPSARSCLLLLYLLLRSVLEDTLASSSTSWLGHFVTLLVGLDHFSTILIRP